MYDIRRNSVELTEKNLAAYDCVLVSTDHTAYDFNFITKHAQLLVDTRNATANVTENREKIVKA